MALASAQVIDALAARLAPMPATGGRVYTSRSWPITEAELPAWRLTADGEVVEPATLEPVDLHTLDLTARGYVRAVADLDDAMHALAASGLALLAAAPTPYQLQLTGIGRGMDGDGEAAIGVVSLQLQCRFYVDPTTPETIHS